MGEAAILADGVIIQTFRDAAVAVTLSSRKYETMLRNCQVVYIHA